MFGSVTDNSVSLVSCPVSNVQNQCAAVITGPQEWVWQEMKAIADMRFKFQEEEDAMEVATRLASTMHLHAPEHVLVAETLHETWDPVLVSPMLGVIPSRCAASEC